MNAVDVGSICRCEVPNRRPVTLEANLTVSPRHRTVGENQVVVRSRAYRDHARTRLHISAAVRSIDHRKP